MKEIFQLFNYTSIPSKSKGTASCSCSISLSIHIIVDHVNVVESFHVLLRYPFTDCIRGPLSFTTFSRCFVVSTHHIDHIVWRLRHIFDRWGVRIVETSLVGKFLLCRFVQSINWRKRECSRSPQPI
uniref:Uncharacterized protein n=1 Tax=Cacopsylla melanoneura TaxID=428564 RepID=A0A8D9DRP0_9HEMI